MDFLETGMDSRLLEALPHLYFLIPVMTNTSMMVMQSYEVRDWSLVWFFFF
jgi:hypothetical protein